MAKFLNVVLFLACCSSTTHSVNSKPGSKAPAEGLELAFSSQLRFATLNADEALNKSPQINFKDGEKKHALDRPPPDYFKRVRELYSNLQRRSESLNIKEILDVPSILFGNSKIEEQAQSSAPIYLKMRSKISLRADTQISDTSKKSTSDEMKKISATESALTNEIKINNGEMKIDSKFTFSGVPSVEQKEPQMVLMRFGDAENQAEKLDPSAIKADNKLVALFVETYKNFLLNSYKDSKSVENKDDTDSEGRGRILGELLYSESAFDKLAKSVIQSTKWILDADIPPSVGGKFGEISNLFNDIRLGAEKLGNRALADLNAETKSTQKGKFDKSVVEPVKSEPSSVDGGNENKATQPLSTKEDRVEATPAKETILSACTDKGILIKLRVGSEFGDPYEYLRNLLTSHNVTLYVQMKPKIGSGALQSGFAKGLPTSALYVNLADANQRNSLLKTLKKFKTDSN